MREDRRSHWDGVYATKPVDGVSWYQAQPSTSLALLAKAGLGSDVSVVDVGGGASQLVGALLDAGVRDVAVLDVAETALAHVKACLGDRASLVTWIVSDVTEWTPARTFDVWHDRALFHFLTEERHREAYRHAMDAALRGGGQAIIATFAPDGPERCSGLPVVRYDAAGLAAELGPGYRLLETRTEDHATPTGNVQRFLYCRFVRRERE